MFPVEDIAESEILFEFLGELIRPTVADLREKEGNSPDIYFFKLDLADIIPQSVPNLTLMNSIARTLGLHDFYQVGLWNFCEGYEDM